MARPKCTALKSDGTRCGAFAVNDSDQCFHHDPGSAAEAAEARRLGGQRRRREAAVAESYSLDRLRTPDDLFRLLDIAVSDTLAEPSSSKRTQNLLRIGKAFLDALRYRDDTARIPRLERALRLQQEGSGESGIDEAAFEPRAERDEL